MGLLLHSFLKGKMLPSYDAGMMPAFFCVNAADNYANT